MLLQGKNAVVTGCNRGIGHAVAEAFAREGANVWVHARTETPAFAEDMHNLSEKYGVQIRPLYFDMTDSEAMKKAVKAIASMKETVDILVNNAGMVDYGAFQMMPLSKIQSIFDVNFFALVSFTQLIVRLMCRQKCGSIVNVASIAGIDSAAGNTAYGSSKAAVIALTKTMSAELASYNIRVNAVAPGMVNTSMMEKIEKNTYDYMVSSIVMKRLGEPDEIANAISFLSSDLASYITGQVIRVDGGMR